MQDQGHANHDRLPATPRQVHFFAARVTKSLSRLASQMERVAVFDFDADETAGSSLVSADLDGAGGELDSIGRGGGGQRWVQVRRKPLAWIGL